MQVSFEINVFILLVAIFTDKHEISNMWLKLISFEVATLCKE